jgi:beta-lactam-binding protein with PASTA domain
VLDPEDDLEDVGPVEDVEELEGRVRILEGPEAAAGEVIGQSPDPGTQVEDGDLVTLEVARHRIEVRWPEPEPDEDEDEDDDEEDDEDEDDDDEDDDDEDDEDDEDDD